MTDSLTPIDDADKMYMWFRSLFHHTNDRWPYPDEAEVMCRFFDQFKSADSEPIAGPNPITPEGLRAEAQRRGVRGYVHYATIREMMQRLADHMETMNKYGSGDKRD